MGTYLMAKAAQARNLVLNTDPAGYIGRVVTPASKVTQGPNTFSVTLIAGKAGKYNRKHSATIRTQAVWYTGGNAMATTHKSGAGNDALTVNVTPVNGLPSTIAIAAGGAGYAVGDLFTLNADATGAGALFTVTAVNAGAVTAASYLANSATPTNCPPDFVISSMQVTPGVPGSPTQENVDPIFYAMRRQACGIQSVLGELNIDWSDPARNWLRNNENTAWDTVGMTDVTISGNINPNATSPSIVCEEEWDSLRNSFVARNGDVYGFNRPFKRAQQNIALVNGQAIINTLKPKGPISRIWIRNLTTAGTISAVELWSDGQCRAKDTWQGLADKYRSYGFHFSPDPSYQAQSIAGSNTLKANLNPINFFDAAVLLDYDQREGQALPIINLDSLELRITSSVAQNATVYLETQPGAFV